MEPKLNSFQISGILLLLKPEMFSDDIGRCTEKPLAHMPPYGLQPGRPGATFILAPIFQPYQELTLLPE
jgi:hypothetical protein